MKRNAERRSHERVATVARAYIVNADSSITGCNVVDLSFSGAKLKVPYESNIQSKAKLCIPSKGIDRQIDVVWRTADHIGVVFSMNTLGCDDALAPRSRELPKPISIDQLRRLALNAVSAEPTTSQKTAGWRWPGEARTISVGTEVWQRACARFKYIVGKHTRILDAERGGVSADNALCDEAFSPEGSPEEAQVGRPPKTEIERLQSPQAPGEARPQHNAAAEPPVGDHGGIGESAHDDDARYRDEALLQSYLSDANPRLRSRKRRYMPVYATAVAVVIAGISAAFFFNWSGVSAGSPTEHRADTATLTKTASPPELTSASATMPNASGVGDARSDAQAVPQLTDSPQPQSASETTATAASAAAPAGPLVPLEDEPIQPSQRSDPAPVSDGETRDKSSGTTSLWLQNAPIMPCLDFTHFVPVETFQATMSAATCEAISRQSSMDANP